MPDPENPYKFFLKYLLSNVYLKSSAVILALLTGFAFYIQLVVPPDQRDGWVISHWPSLKTWIICWLGWLILVGAWSFVKAHNERMDQQRNDLRADFQGQFDNFKQGL